MKHEILTSKVEVKLREPDFTDLAQGRHWENSLIYKIVLETWLNEVKTELCVVWRKSKVHATS